MYNLKKHVKIVDKGASQTPQSFFYYQYPYFCNSYILPFISYLEENIG